MRSLPDDATVRAVLAGTGLAVGERLGRGVEGSVHALVGDRRESPRQVVKVWFGADPARLDLLAAFLDALPADGGVRFPRIVARLQAGPWHATVEQRLDGVPLAGGDGGPRAVDDRVEIALVTVLDALRRVPHDDALTGLPVLGDEPALRPPFTDALAALVRRRGTAFREPLAVGLGTSPRETNALVDRVAAAVADVRPAAQGLVHGDLVPGNVLVAPGLAPAVIDLGFLSTHGDPDFDAVVAACIFDMYGPGARQATERLTALVSSRYGIADATVAAYRGAYAVATACCFGTTRADGHVAWCLDLLERDVLPVL